MIKALFFDIDGTLVSMGTHTIPASAVEAITQAKRKGVKVFIATGRPYSIINNIDAILPFIDGYLTANGAHCMVGNEVVYHCPISKCDVELILNDATEQDYSCVVVGEKDITTYNYKDNIDRIFRRTLDIHGIDYHLPIDNVMQYDILQLTPFATVEQEQQLMPRIPDCVSGRWHPEFMDVTSRMADKGRGLTAIAQHLGIPLKDCAAFGDGGNDISMIRAAGVGVAMGNAGDDVKQAADFVTTHIDEDGIMHAMQHLEIV